MEKESFKLPEDDKEKVCEVILSHFSQRELDKELCKRKMDTVSFMIGSGSIPIQREDLEKVLDFVKDEILLFDENARIESAVEAIVPDHIKRNWDKYSKIREGVNRLTREKEQKNLAKHGVDDWTKSLQEFGSDLSLGIQNLLAKEEEKRFHPSRLIAKKYKK